LRGRQTVATASGFTNTDTPSGLVSFTSFIRPPSTVEVCVILAEVEAYEGHQSLSGAEVVTPACVSRSTFITPALLLRPRERR
jgi:hypothetical protein